MEKDRRSSTGTTKKKGSSFPKMMPSVSVNKMEEDGDPSWLVGSIVEKGFSSTNKNPLPPSSLPRPTVVPFPVARHRSHGPHWGPLGSENFDHKDEDDDIENKDDNDFDSIAAFANPLERKQKKTLDFSRWRELGQKDNGSTVTQERITNKPALVEVGNQNGGREEAKNADMGTTLLDSSTSTEVNGKPTNSSGSRIGSRETTTNDSGVGVLGSVCDMEQDNFDSLPVPECIGYGEAESRDAKSDNPEDEQGHMPLESQIDAENRARLHQMSADEIAEAQAEILEKMKPGLVEVLKKRGRDKLVKQKSKTPNLATGHQLGTPLDKTHSDKSPIGAPLSQVGKNSHIATTTPTKDTQRGQDNGGLQMLGTRNSSSWKAWSERVEAVRALRFSLDGTVLENDSVQVPKNGKDSDRGQYSADNVTERDFLRTEGDPAAVGYTIKEAVAMSRSVVPGQRALALQLLGIVLNKALCNFQHSQVGCNMRTADNIDKSVDWKAVWAFAVGPEPELVLSLRMGLDDNHKSVVLACAKVIQCVLTCDMNETFFDISEKLATCERAIFTAPVFRSRPEIDVGFLHGGFWKYSTKPSNILPSGDEVVDDESEGKHTIQDDVVVAGQDFAAGLVRMGILPRIRYLLETDPCAALEECLISILTGLARHSPTCVNAIMKCQRLVQTVVDSFTKKDTMEIRLSKIKSVTLLKVLAQSDEKNCINFAKNGIFRDTMWHLYRYAFSLDHWIKSGREYCKLTSALMVEQLRFWKVCIQYGYCISYFADFFTALCLWLSPPAFDKLIDNNVLHEFTSIAREAYLVLEVLARTLPNLHTEEQLKLQNPDFTEDNMEHWSWSYVGPMVELALKWIPLIGNPCLSKTFDWHKGNKTNFLVQDSSVSCLLWVISSIMHMLSSILERVVPDDFNSFRESNGHLPWLPEFVPRIGLEIGKNGSLNFSGTNDTVCETVPTEGGSFVKDLCYLRHHSDNETSLSSTCCLHGLARLVISIDKSIQAAKNNTNQSPQAHSFSRDAKILEDGIVTWSQDELRSLLVTFMKLVASEWHNVQTIEMYGRGGTAPGIGLGWGASGGGFWSTTVLLAEEDARLLIDLLEIFPIVIEKDPPAVEDMTFTLQRVNSVLGVCLTVGPRDKVILEKALDILLGATVLKYLNLCARHFLRLRGIKSSGWAYNEEDYICFSNILTSHFRNRWLCVKRKSKEVNINSDPDHRTFTKNSNGLDTIHEDLDTSGMNGHDCYCSSLVIEWAHQRLPLPMHWFLSPISTICDRKAAQDLLNVSNIKNRMCSPTDEVLEVAKSGLFLLLGLEAMNPFLCTDVQHSPVWGVPLVWKLHSLSMVLLVTMGVIEEEKSRDVYRTLQELYGKLLDEIRCRTIKPPMDNNENLLPENGKKYGVEYLLFQTDVHESYSTFIETLVEQFAAVSYGDEIYGRQIAMYLHRTVEAPVRLAAWNALSNSHILDLLPPLEKCFAEAEGYLEPVEDNEGILEAYVKSWISGALDRAATRGSFTFTLALHHLSSFIFHNCADDKRLLRNKLVKSLLRDYSRKQQHEGMMLDIIRYTKPATSQKPEWMEGSLLQRSEMERRFMLLTEACEGNSSLLSKLEALKSFSEHI